MRSLAIWLFFLIECHIIGAQILSHPRLQPWPLKIPSMSLCCGDIEDAEKLLSCANQSKSRLSNNSHISFLSYSSPSSGVFGVKDIKNFAAYQISIMSAYCEQNGYSFKIFNSDNSNYEPVDARWNKIRIMDIAFKSWAQNVSYLVWIDSDAIILDFGMKIELIVSQFPDADIIASSDIRMGYINSGFMILRNSQWTRSFLSDWWNIADRKQVCDQDAFDMAYKKHLGRQSSSATLSNVKILRMDALNSHPPAILYQKDFNQVLHLMGEVTLLRQKVFYRGFFHICESRSGGILPPQLGLHQPTMLSIAQDVYFNTTRYYLNFINQSIDPSLEMFEELSKCAHHYSDILRASPSPGTSLAFNTRNSATTTEQIHSLHHGIFKLVANRLVQLNSTISDLKSSIIKYFASLQANETLEASSSSSSSLASTTASSKLDINATIAEYDSRVYEYVVMLKRGAESGNDVFGSLSLSADKYLMADKVFQILEELYAKLADESRHIPLHMKALMLQNLGVMNYDMFLQGNSTLEASMKVEKDSTKLISGMNEEDSSLLMMAKKYFAESVEVFLEVLKRSSNEDISTWREFINSYQMLSGVTCSMGHYREGMLFWEKTIDYSRQLMRGIPLGVPSTLHAEVLYNAAQCFAQGDRFGRSVDFLEEAIAIRKKILLEMNENNAMNLQEDPMIKLCTELLKVSKEKELARNLPNRHYSVSSGSTTTPLLNDGTTKMPPTMTQDMLQSDEWEECQEGEPECQEFVIEDSWMEDSSSPFRVPIKDSVFESTRIENTPSFTSGVDHDRDDSPSRSNLNDHIGHWEEKEEEEEEEDDELELAELQEIRELYARQSSMYRQDPTFPQSLHETSSFKSPTINDLNPSLSSSSISDNCMCAENPSSTDEIMKKLDRLEKKFDLLLSLMKAH